MKAHPVADLLPMLADDELAEMAADIRERGLLQPIVLDSGGQFLDGLNRLAACEIAGVEPTFTTYDGDDPEGYALAVNIARRHLNKGQIAMVAARARSLSEQTINEASESTGASRTRIGQASTVLSHAPDLADSVVSGATSLNEAYEAARRNKEIAESAEAKLLTLRAEAPDLAELVAEERITLATAITELRARDAQERERQQRWTQHFGASLMLVWSCLDPDPVKAADRNWIPERNPHRDMPEGRDLYTAKGLRTVADLLTGLADHLEDTGSDLL
jgi:ParB-like chromosome segregation protein Spo0J